MDKEFEEWLYKTELTGFPVSDARLAWNASKQHWLDKAVDAVYNADCNCDDSGNAAINNAAENVERLKK